MRLFFLVFFIFFGSSTANAIEQNIPSKIQTLFKTSAEKVYPTMKQGAISIFASLALIEMVLIFGFMAARQEIEFGGIIAQLIRLILYFGIFMAIIEMGQISLKVIPESFQQIGTDASGIDLSSIANSIGVMWAKIADAQEALDWDQVGAYFSFFIAGLVVTFALTYLIGQFLLYYAFAIFSIYIGILWMGFGAFSYTRPWALGAVTQVFKYSAKLMMTIVLMGVFMGLVNTLLASEFDFDLLITLIVFSFLMVSIVGGISGFIDGLFSGHGGGDNNRGVAMMMGASSAATGLAGAAVAGGIAGAMSGGKTAKDSIAAARGGMDGNPGVDISKGKAFMTRASAMLGGANAGSGEGSIKGAGSRSVWHSVVDGANAGKAEGLSTGGKAADTFAKELKKELSEKTPSTNNSGTIGNGSQS